jgi:hypothetical protein
MSKNNLTLNFGDKVIRFKMEDFEDDLDIDNLLKIDYSNLVAELITFSVILNKIGILSAEMDSELRLSKLNLKIKESKIRQQVREELTFNQDGGKIKNPTVQEVEDGMNSNKIFVSISKKHIQTEKECDYIKSIYEAAKQKSAKLDRLSFTIQVGDVDEALVQKQLNKIQYRIKEGYIK